MFENIIAHYWGLIAVAVGFLIYGFTARAQAVKVILSLMLRLEKEAEQLALATGEAKFYFLIDKGYTLLPVWARLFISKELFTLIARKLYEKAKDYLIQLQKKEPPQELN